MAAPVFGPYEVVERVAVGSTGTVFRVRHTGLDRVAAVKELSSALRGVPGLLERFRGEAEILAELDHPNVVEVYDYVEEPDRAWIVEEWVDGASLDAILTAHGRLSPEQSVGVMRGALMGLAHAHDRGLVHRDIAPGNILADLAGTSKLVDFGLAAPVGGTSALGTPAFISPEAARGEPVGKSSDVYSAAAVMFALLAGRPPFPAADPVSMLRRHVEDPPPSLSGHGADLEDLVRRSMAKDAAVRPPDAGAFLVELEEAARRRFGAGWLGRASIAGVVASTVAGTAAVGGASTSAVAGATVIDTAAVATGAAKGFGKLSRTATIGIAAAVAVVVVAVAVGATTLTSNDTDGDTTAAGDTQNTRAASESPTPTTSTPSPTPTPPSFADLAPSGVYDTQLVVVSTTYEGEAPGDTSETTWTFIPTCTSTACTGTINSSSGRVFTYTWDGSQLILDQPAPETGEGLCVDDVTGEEIPGTLFEYTSTSTWSPLVSTPSGPTDVVGPPETLKGTLAADTTATGISPNCRDERNNNLSNFTATWQGSEPTVSTSAPTVTTSIPSTTSR